jgi:hypothetical protein
MDKTTDISSEAIPPFTATYTAGDAVTEGVKLLGISEKNQRAHKTVNPFLRCQKFIAAQNLC